MIPAAKIGIKIVNLHTNKLVKILGKVEQTERFLGIALYQGKAMKRKAGLGESVVEGENEQKESADPIAIVTSYKKNRCGFQSEMKPCSLDSLIICIYIYIYSFHIDMFRLKAFEVS